MSELSDERRDELIERWAAQIVTRGLGTPGVFLLEAHKPLARLGSQVMLGLRPLLESVFPIDARELAAFLRDPENVERLVLRIEQLDRQRREDDDAAESR